MPGNRRTLLIKVGTGVIVHERGRLDYSRIAAICHDLAELLDRGTYDGVLLVTSGAVAAGRFAPDHARRNDHTYTRSVLAAVGQPRLIAFYSSIFMEHGLHVAQFLVNREDFGLRPSYLAVRDSISSALTEGIIPVINENDPIKANRAGFSDNDQLAAFIAGMMHASEVVFLSSVEGLYPRFPPETAQLPIANLDGEISNYTHCVSHCTSQGGSGGMASKLNAVKLLFDLGIPATIASGVRNLPVLTALDKTSIASRTSPRPKRQISGIRRWLSTGAVPQGTLYVSPHGGQAIRRECARGSLLSKGIAGLSGAFHKGDVVRVCDENQNLLGYGVARIGSDEIDTAKSCDSTIVIHANYFYGTGAWV